MSASKSPYLQQNLVLYGLFILSIFVTYFLPGFVSYLFFLGLLVLFFRSDENVFWFAFAFILLDPPGGFFSQAATSDTHNFPLYRLGPGLSFSFTDLFVVLALIKTMLKSRRSPMFMDTPLKWLGIYILFLTGYSFLLGVQMKGFLSNYRIVFALTLYISFPALCNNVRDFKKYLYYLFPLIFISLFAQVWELTRGISLYYLVTGQSPEHIVSIDKFQTIAMMERVIYSPFISFVCLLGSLFLMKTEKSANKTYLFTVALASIILIFLSATRLWTIAFIMMFLFYFVLEKFSGKLLYRLAIPIGLIIVLLIFQPKLIIQLGKAFERLSTVEQIVKGNIAAEQPGQQTEEGLGTSRITDYGPQVMSVFYEYPIFGVGFSSIADDNRNGHVGFQNILLEGGIFEMFLFLFLWIDFLVKILKINRGLSKANPYKGAMLLFIGGLLGLLTVHAGSQMFGFALVMQYRIFPVVSFFLMADLFAKEALRLERASIHREEISNT
jgi:hypothetical protein